MKTIDTYDLLDLLSYKDLKAVRTWCEKNGVFIMKQGKREFVNETNFYVVYWQQFIAHLKSKHGANWEEVYKMYKDDKVDELYMLTHSVSKKLPIYRKNLNNENSIIKRIEDYEKEKKKNAA